MYLCFPAAIRPITLMERSYLCHQIISLALASVRSFQAKQATAKKQQWRCHNTLVLGVTTILVWNIIAVTGR
jgi:hypothetical protein